MHTSICAVDYLPGHTRRLSFGKGDFAHGERVCHARFQLIRSYPVAVIAVGYQRVCLTPLDKIDPTNLNVRDGIANILRDDAPNGRIARKVERFAKV